MRIPGYPEISARLSCCDLSRRDPLASGLFRNLGGNPATMALSDSDGLGPGPTFLFPVLPTTTSTSTTQTRNPIVTTSKEQ
eukprot:3215273-Rhodomonas_salina.1